MENLKLGPQPKANPVATFTMSSTSAPSSTSSTANQDYSTVNLSDLHEFFPNISSAMAQESAAPQGGAAGASLQTASSFPLQESQFRAEPSLVDDDIPEFPSFTDPQGPNTLDSLNMDEFEDLLNPHLMSESGAGASLLTSSQHQAAQNGAATSQNNSDHVGNPGSTYMNYPNSIANLLRSEDMMALAANNNNQQPPVLDDFDVLMSADEDRLMSIFNSGTQAGFVSGNPT